MYKAPRSTPHAVFTGGQMCIEVGVYIPTFWGSSFLCEEKNIIFAALKPNEYAL